jgi:hypothetical protein
MHALVAVQDFPQNIDGAPDFFRRRIVGDGDVGEPADMGPLPDVFQPLWS